MAKPNCTIRNKKLQRVKDTATFIEKAKSIHGCKYDYRLCRYKGTITRVCIICPKHGEFWQRASNHLKGHGCPECGKTVKTERLLGDGLAFIEECKKVHNGKYDYSKSEYRGILHDMLIICPEHGEFWQTARAHRRGSGCRSCAVFCGLSQDRFIERFLESNGDGYDLSQVEYKNQTTKVKIGCPKHGFFWVLPQAAIKGFGCRQCSKTSSWGEDAFFDRLPDRHKSKYDYSKIGVISSSKQKLAIVCPEHGEFVQSAKNHASGHGCPECSKESIGFGRASFLNACNRNSAGLGTLYVIKCFNKDEVFYKVGITSTSIDNRFSGDSAMPYDYTIEFAHIESGLIVFDLEKSIHRALKDVKYLPKIFFGGMTECFTTIKPVEKLLKELSTTEQLQLLA